MRKIIPVNGGAGRVICSVPAFERLAKSGQDFIILAEGGMDFYMGNPLLQDRVFHPGHKGLFEQYIRDGEFINIEPYRDHGYYNQTRSLAEAFDHQINGVTEHKDLDRPRIVLNRSEEVVAAKVIADAKEYFKKDKVVILQPFGRSANKDRNMIFDPSSRSLTPELYTRLAKSLATKFAVIYMGEIECPDDPCLRPNLNLRQWAAVIEEADYFVGCDSVGQHIAYAFNKPGTVFLGSTFAVNTSYQDHFQIIEKEGVKKVYSPIRVCQMDCQLADHVNEGTMEFSSAETSSFIERTVKHARKKAGVGA